MSEGCKKLRQNLKLQAILQRGYFHILFPLFNVYWQIGRSLNSEELLVIFRGGSRPSDKERRGGRSSPGSATDIWEFHSYGLLTCSLPSNAFLQVSNLDICRRLGTRSTVTASVSKGGQRRSYWYENDLFILMQNSFSHERFYTEHVLKMWIFNTSERDTFFSSFFCRGKGGKDSGEEKLLSSNFSNSFQRPYAMYKL